MLSLNLKQKLIKIAKEDIGKIDATSFLIKGKTTKASIIAGESCVIGGIEEAVFLFNHFGVKTLKKKKDSSIIKKGQSVLIVFGNNKKILGVERTVLNILGRMSGVATLCSKATKIAKRKSKIFLTRKTMPGFNDFDKRACVYGGVYPHRINLSESILIKENHLKFETISNLIKKAKQKKKKLKVKEIEIEVENQKEALIAVKNSPDVIMLDNFSPQNAKKTIRKIRSINKKVQIELSGGINLKNLKNYVNLKANRISMGQLTRDSRMIDFSLEIK